MKVCYAPNTRAVRVVWLLNELGLDYELERYKLGAQAAFAMLAKLSQESNIKLADIAHQVVADAEREASR